LVIHYLQQCNDYTYSKQEWPLPLPYVYAQSLLPSGPPFNPWIEPSKPTDVYHPVIDLADDSHFVADTDFIKEQD